MKCSGCIYVGSGEARAERTPGNSFLCHHSKTCDPIGRDARLKKKKDLPLNLKFR